MSTRRVTVSLPEGTADQLAGMAHAAGAPSVSAYVTEAVQARIARDEALRQLRAAWGEPDPQALAWARALILQQPPAQPAGEPTEEHPL